MKIVNVTTKRLTKELQRRGVFNPVGHEYVLQKLEALKAAKNFEERKALSLELVLYIEAQNVEYVLLEAGHPYSKPLFRTFINHGIPTYVVEQL